MNLTIKASEYCHSVFDGTHATPKPCDKGYKLVTSKHISNNVLDYESAYFISESDYLEINKRSKVSQWDILFSMIGTVGDLYLEYNENIDYVIKNIGIKKKKNELKAKWLFYYLKSPLAQNHIKRFLNGAVQKFLSLKQLRDFPVLSFDENKIFIVKILSALDQKIAINNQINAQLEQMAKTLYDYWFVQFDFPDENGKPYQSSGGEMVYNDTLKRNIPKGWEVGQIKDYCVSTGGFAFKSTEWTNYGNPVIKIKNIKEDQTLDIFDIDCIDLSNKKKKKKFKGIAGNIVIAMTGATIGKFAIIPKSDVDLYINQRVGYFNLGNEPINRLPFFINSLNMDYFRDAIFALSSGAAQPNISNEQINNINLLIPNESLIRIFNQKLKSNYSLILNNQYENQQLTQLRDFLLPMLMNGQVMVQDV